MSTRRLIPEMTRFASLDRSETEVLPATHERSLLQELVECKRKLAQALAGIEGLDIPPDSSPQATAHYIAAAYAVNGPDQARLGAVYRRYSELRGKLALANFKLVAHVAKRFRERGIPYSDLLQEGFCGLLEAIDRFDMTHETKLATYATWWIRQAMQRAVASGAYPVRLTPRHLRQLAQNQVPDQQNPPGRTDTGLDRRAGIAQNRPDRPDPYSDPADRLSRCDLRLRLELQPHSDHVRPRRRPDDRRRHRMKRSKN